MSFALIVCGGETSRRPLAAVNVVQALAPLPLSWVRGSPSAAALASGIMVKADSRGRVMRLETLGCELVEQKRLNRIQHKKLMAKWGLSTIAAQIAWLVFNYFFVPGYITPFLNHPIGRLSVIVLYAWSMIGWFVGWCIPFSSRGWFKAALACEIVFFSLPAFGIAMLGPAIIQILMAMGPIMSGH